LDSGHHSGDFPEIRGFEILGWGGSGGMGEVWRALQMAEQRIVAIKILRAPAGPPARQALIAERFKREIVLAAQFDHPALTRVLGSGASLAGQAYVVMEWIEGLPLDEFVTTKALPLAQRIGLGVAIARGVQQLHERGCIHRDLKPGNILVTESGKPRILDFGLARPLDAMELGPTVSLEGDLIGTPHFMSPEQAAGEFHPGGHPVRRLVARLAALFSRFGAMAMAGRPAGGRCPAENPDNRSPPVAPFGS
jgi:serine/threonine protein kinase